MQQDNAEGASIIFDVAMGRLSRGERCNPGLATGNTTPSTRRLRGVNVRTRARRSSAATDFSWSTYMRECVIAGEIAERVEGTKITWDAKIRRFDSDAANAFLTRDYRKGWEIPGLA